MNDESNGNYTCTVSAGSTSTWLLGFYNTTMNASKQYYNSSQFLQVDDGLKLVTDPFIENVIVSTSDSNNPGGWGELWTFTTSLYDSDQATYDFERINLSLWYYNNSAWRLLNTTLCNAPDCCLLYTSDAADE